MSAREKIIQNLKRLGRNVLLALLTTVAFVLVLEVAYRCYWFDFYSKEATLLNEKSDKKKHTKTVLILGDSFTASANNYCEILNNSISDVRFINSAVPGFGIQEEAIIAKDRIEEFHPDAVILQVYAGNDLLDLEKPINWSSLNTARNLYWSVSNYLLSLRYINYKAGQFKTNTSLSTEYTNPKELDVFSVDNYSLRERILITADKRYLEKSIMLTDEYSARFKKYTEYADQIIRICDEQHISLTIMIIPASCQVSKSYQQNDQLLGADFRDFHMQDTTYPFLAELSKMYSSKATVISPLPVFQRLEASGNSLYYQNDIHLNALGQKVLAAFLINKRALFIPR